MTDRFAARVAIIVLAIIAVAGFGAIVYSATTGRAVDPLLAGIVTGAIGVLSPSPLRSGGTSDVRVVNAPDDAVPVEAGELGAVELISVVAWLWLVLVVLLVLLLLGLV